MRLYISGPMSGRPYFNIHQFDAMARLLRGWNNDVISPAELDEPAFRQLCLECETGSILELRIRCQRAEIEPATWGDLLARDIKLLANEGVEGIVVLDGWESSRGAVLETVAGRLIDIPIFRVSGGHLVSIAPDVLEGVHANCAGKMHKYNSDPLPECAIDSGDPEACNCAHPHECYRPEGGTLPAPSRAWFVEREVRAEEEQGIEPVVPAGSGNPKDRLAQAQDKPPLEFLEPAADELIARVMQNGAKKYGRRNYIAERIDLMVYIAAIKRHVAALQEGQDLDPDTGIHHLAHVGANVHVVLAALKAGTLNDNRPLEGEVRRPA